MKNTVSRTFLLCALLGIISASWSATTTSTFSVTATIAPTCTVTVGSGAFGFGSIPNPINSNIDVNGQMQATCSAGTPYAIAYSAGNGAGATFAARKLTAGPNTLSYTFYTDPGRTTPWGDGTAGSSVVNGIGNGAVQQIPMFGRIPSGQNVPQGIYRDTVFVTLTF